MVAVSSERADAILARPLTDVSVVLLHGSDPGLVTERIKLTIKMAGIDPHDPFQLVRLDGAEVASDPARLPDECGTMAMFGSKRMIWVSPTTADISAAVENACQFRASDWMLIIEAGALKKDSLVRRFCEKQKYALSIECDQDEQPDLSRLLDLELQSANISVDDETRSVILRSIGGDRMSTRAELEKLALLGHGQGVLRLEDVEAILSDPSSIAIEKMINAAFSGDIPRAEECWKRIQAAAIDSSTIIGTSLREAVSLHLYTSELERKSSGDFALQKYRRTAFGRQPLDADKLRLWTNAKAQRAVEILGEALKRSRSNTGLSEEIGIRALWSIALLVGRPLGRAAGR